jgi:hypothetical protein
MKWKPLLYFVTHIKHTQKKMKNNAKADISLTTSIYIIFYLSKNKKDISLTTYSDATSCQPKLPKKKNSISKFIHLL